jgi:mannose-6-phosphate isomerase-like protein (cupin superfamily)
MIIADLARIPGGTFPARRWGRGLVGQLGQPIPAKGFSMGYSILEPRGGQVPWHNQEQEEVYFIVQGEGKSASATSVVRSRRARRSSCPRPSFTN